MMMNRVKLGSLFSAAEWRSIEGAQYYKQQSAAAAVFMESCSFHSTAALERKRRNQWHYNFNCHGKRKRNRNRESKRALFRNISDYAEFLFQSWREEEQRNARPSWFRGHRWVRGTNRTHGFNPYGFHNSANFSRNNGKDDFDSNSSDDEGPETVFQSTFGGGRFYWSFNLGGSTHHTSYNSRRWSYYSDEEEDDDDDDDERFGTGKTISEMALARQTLGLSASGPLKIEEVKTAYRTCALRWHPDRHHGSSKVEAEEKFKHCSAAYKTLCDRLA